MGGRLDSTNVIENPLACIITGIALDHTAYLGDTEEKIAAEKAGIIKAGSPVLFGGEHEGAYAVISRKSEEIGVPCYRTERGAIDIKKADRDGTVFDYKQWKDVKINLLGLYQPLNAANVLECVEMLNFRGFTVSNESVYKGLEAARWQARFEIIRKEPLMIFDGSHNPEGVAAAVATIKRYFGEEKVRIITGVMADKDYMGMVRDISSVACEVYTVRPDNPRALDAESLAEKYRSCGVSATPFDSVETAVDAVILRKTDKTPTVCMGSLYMYCQVMDALEK
jgi:dihydrofolate synthase/folylpolyglutamate synthase